MATAPRVCSKAADRDTMLKAVFVNLEGTWKLARSLTSANAMEPSGKCTGTVTFTKRTASIVPDTRNPDLEVLEMVYHEQGEFELEPRSPGPAGMLRLPFSRKYIWRMTFHRCNGRPLQPQMSIWFTKPGTEVLDYLFHILDFQENGFKEVSSENNNAPGRLWASGSHLCIRDKYESNYDFTLSVDDQNKRTFELCRWSSSHSVKGPDKDQLIENVFNR